MRRSAYGANKRFSLRSLMLTLGAQLALVPVVISLNHQGDFAPQQRLVTVDLTPAATPPPPAPSKPEDQTPTAQITAPPAPFALTAAPAVPVAEPGETPTPRTSSPASAASPGAAPGPPATPATPAAPSAPDIIGSDSLGSALIAGDPPRYPHESRRKKEQGTVELLVIVGTDGRVETISVARSSGSPRLDQAALKAVRSWRWQPVRRNGQAVKVRGIVEIPFVLTSARKKSPRADCDSPDSDCRSADGPARDDRRGRMDRRHGDFRPSGPDDQE